MIEKCSWTARQLVGSGLVTLGLLLAVPMTAIAQQTTGAPGSPDATRTIDGRYLPNPPPQFGGDINVNAYQSKPYWPARVMPPKGAPNVLLIMTDDVGFGAPSTFGGVIPTPAMDRIANMGLRYTQFHSTALCSPTRAALITGRNHHSVGFGQISELSTGYPGYNSILSGDRYATAHRADRNKRARQAHHSDPAYQRGLQTTQYNSRVRRDPIHGCGSYDGRSKDVQDRT